MVILRIVTSALHYLPEIGFRVGFGQWLQLVCCANLLAADPSISIIKSTSSELIGTEHSLNRSEHRVQNEAS